MPTFYLDSHHRNLAKTKTSNQEMPLIHKSFYLKNLLKLN